MYTLNVNDASAATSGQEIEVTFNEYRCGTLPPGAPEPELLPAYVTIKTTVPNTVAKDEEFYLTNTSIIVGAPFRTEPGGQPMESAFEGINFTIMYGNENTEVRTFVPDLDFVVPPGTDGLPITIAEGMDVGPFIADEDGEVILKTDEIRMNWLFGFDLPVGPISLGFMCQVPEGKEFSFATIPIDSEAPVITLNGDNPMIVKQGDEFIDPGATAEDNFDGDVSDDIEVSGADDIDTSTIGEYTITYTVSDSVGNVATVERTVNVVEPFGDWYTGEGPPNDSLGSNGDSYLDIATGDIYKRDPNTWTKIGNLKGDNGKQGSAILTGSGAPSADAGDIGDLYLDTNTGDVYEKTADGWKKTANLQGPAGPQGPKGPKGAAGTSGGSGSGDDGGGKSTTKTSTSSDKDGKGKSAQGGKLPKTATSLPTLVLIGALLTAIGGVLFLRRRKLVN
ncbi:immunoglobulin-like domain-containing protein [Pueribacillus sp. YX66]|uniref:immunoglobulin-like domain-containing protein n=1 Tax=Pueribacillus sp. YX66 TaxID=3229242 RepID=UPI00358CE13C